MIKDKFLEWIKSEDYPCIGSKAAARKKCIHFFYARDIATPEDDISILSHLYSFIDNWKSEENQFQSLVIFFEQSKNSDEITFEKYLWARLANLHTLDHEIYDWDPTVSSNVNDANFSFSIGGQAFFVVGLHPHSSRHARRFECPALVFNLHEQFNTIREHGNFSLMVEKIRNNDRHYSGSINPMVEEFGKSSEALQYSGRQLDANYQCPFAVSKKRADWNIISSSSGASLVLKKGSLLVVQDPLGEQVSDLFCFSVINTNEIFSVGKTIDINQTVYLSQGHTLYSNFSNPMITIVKDDVKKHDLTMAPCDRKTFAMLYDDCSITSGCYEHLTKVLNDYDINPYLIQGTFNIFMNVTIDEYGKTLIQAPLSKAGDKIIFRSEMDLIIALTACSAPNSNNQKLKPIYFKIIQNSC